MTVAAGENAECTITNTRIPTLKVTKVLVPSTDSGLFDLKIDTVTEATDVGDGGMAGPNQVAIEAHTVSEVIGTVGTLTDYTTVISGDCDVNGDVTVVAGENAACTITNTRIPTLKVTKVLVPSDDTGRFDLKIDTVTEAMDVGVRQGWA